MKHMCQFRMSYLPVTDQQGKVLGLVTETHVLKALLKLQAALNTSTSDKVHQEQPISPHPPDHSETQSKETMEASVLLSQ